MNQRDLPPITDAHRRAAHQRLAMVGWSYEAARRDELRRRLIEACAADIRTREWRAMQSRVVRCVPRLDPVTGRWVTQIVPGEWAAQQSLIET